MVVMHTFPRGRSGIAFLPEVGHDIVIEPYPVFYYINNQRQQENNYGYLGLAPKAAVLFAHAFVVVFPGIRHDGYCFSLLSMFLA